MYVVVTGPPASGKSTLGRALAAELRLPLLAKDVIRAGLVEFLGGDSVEEVPSARCCRRALLGLARAKPARCPRLGLGRSCSGRRRPRSSGPVVDQRAQVFVTVDADAGVVRLEGEHRDGSRLERVEPLSSDPR